MNSETLAKLPEYQCHKRVRAARIEAIEAQTLRRGDLCTHFSLGLAVGEDKDLLTTVTVTAVWVAKHNPQPGGWFVVYDDGYQSYSPDKAFSEGYSPITRLPGIDKVIYPSTPEEAVKLAEEWGKAVPGPLVFRPLEPTPKPQIPSIGRIVHYQHINGAISPAMILFVYRNLPMQPEDRCYLLVHGLLCDQRIDEVAYGNEPGMWSWPRERRA